MNRKASGQSLVEFALIIPLFIALMVGLLDGTRLLFTYNELQEAARVGARWGAIEVGRDNWGTYATCGNKPGSYTESFSVSPGNCVNPAVSTIVSEAASKLVAIDHSEVNLTISTSIASSANDTGTQDTLFEQSVTVKAEYTFTPILSFGHFGIKLAGKSVMYHA